MDDRELLEMAAKAAGIEGEWCDCEDHADGILLDDMRCLVWNPLTDDGDALRLAVKLDMQIWRRTDGTVCSMCKGIDFWQTLNEPLGDDPYAATRRAIVRAAAEIARAGAQKGG